MGGGGEYENFSKTNTIGMGTYSRTARTSFNTEFSPQSSLNNRKKTTCHLLKNLPVLYIKLLFPTTGLVFFMQGTNHSILEKMILCKTYDDDDVDGLLLGGLDKQKCVSLISSEGHCPWNAHVTSRVRTTYAKNRTHDPLTVPKNCT